MCVSHTIAVSYATIERSFIIETMKADIHRSLGLILDLYSIHARPDIYILYTPDRISIFYTRQTGYLYSIHARPDIYILYTPDRISIFYTRQTGYLYSIHARPDIYILYTPDRISIFYTRQTGYLYSIHARPDIYILYTPDRISIFYTRQTGYRYQTTVFQRPVESCVIRFRGYFYTSSMTSTYHMVL